MKKLKKLFLSPLVLISTIIVILIGLIAFNAYQIDRAQSDAEISFSKREMKQVKLGRQKFTLYISNDDAERSLGLSGVTTMNSDEGMAFLFESADLYGFWMKDMLFPLDFVYLHNEEVVDLIENVAVDTFPNTIAPSVPADTIIEIHAGQIKKSGIEIGDLVDLR